MLRIGVAVLDNIDLTTVDDELFCQIRCWYFYLKQQNRINVLKIEYIYLRISQTIYKYLKM